MQLLRSRPWRSTLFWLAAGQAISLGTRIVIGTFEVPAPHALLASFLPALDRFRVPSRLGVASLVGFALLTGLAFARIASRLRLTMQPSARAWAGAATLALALITAAALRIDQGLMIMSPKPFPSEQAVPPPASFLEVLARVPGPLVEVPTTPMPLPSSNPRMVAGSLGFALHQAMAMANSTYHWHPILNGYSSYFPAGFRQRIELANELPEHGALKRLVQEAQLRFVWVHLRRLRPKQRALWTRMSTPDPLRPRPTLRLVAAEGDSLLFVVDP